MFSRLKEALSRATRSEHATNEINEGGEEVDSPFTSQIDPVLFESAHVSTPVTTSIGPLKLTPSETLLSDGRSLAEVQKFECYILAAREKEIESLRKAERRQEILAKAPMTSALPANPLQSSELIALMSQTIGSHIASSSKDTPNTSILDGVLLNENWEYESMNGRVRVPGGLLDAIESIIGVKQGCLLSSTLFGIYTDELSKYVDTYGDAGYSLVGVMILLLLYADDVVLILDSPKALQRKLDALQRFCVDRNLTVNLGKTKVMVFNTT
ncbi:hypothetical protein L7F22_026788 [Adiantum nelumboides]|nr:hypothetical protein [Adiantum nelumboides]